MDNVPNEIMIKILSYLPTSDLLQFLKADENYYRFLREKHVIQFLNFKDLFEISNNFDLCQFISTNIAYKYIKTLNINSLYWIPLQDIRELISKLERLEELYAIDTKLGVAVKDIDVYGRLKKLAISVEAGQLDTVKSNVYFKRLYGLKKFCLKFNSKKENFEEMYSLFYALKQLTELWIYDNDVQYGINYERIVAYLPNLNKFVIKSRRPIPILDFSCWGINKIYQNQRCDSAVEIIFVSVFFHHMYHESRLERCLFCLSCIIECRIVDWFASVITQVSPKYLMENNALIFAPVYWDTKAQGNAVRKEFIIDKHSCEFLQLSDEVRNAVLSRKSCKTITRNQNLHDLDRLLKWEQMYNFSCTPYYRVRRFAVVKKEYLQNALDYNLDYRKCGLPEIKLFKYVTDVLEDEVLLIIQVSIRNLSIGDYRPSNFSQYMIDYIVELNQTAT